MTGVGGCQNTSVIYSIKISSAFAIKSSKLFFVDFIQDNQSTSRTRHPQSPADMSNSERKGKPTGSLVQSNWEAEGREIQLKEDRKEEKILKKEGKKVPPELRKRIVEGEKAKEGRGRQFKRVSKHHSSLGSPAPPQSKSGATEEEHELVTVTRAESVGARSQSRNRGNDRTRTRGTGTDGGK